MKEICVIGSDGYVGQSIVNLFKNHPGYLVKTIEKESRSADLTKVDLAIICVPTPMKTDGSCDTSIVEGVLRNTDFPLYLIKSAVPPGTCSKFGKLLVKNIVVSPEYIGEGRYPTPWWEGIPHPTDVSKHDFQIFGGVKRNTTKVVDLFTPVMGPYCKYIQTDFKTAELVKYMENSYYATKVVFCHTFSKIAKTFGVDYNELRELWLLDKRVNRGSTAVFDKDKLGYGGKCLPKDISAIYTAAKEAGYQPDLLWQVMKVNAQLGGPDDS